MSPLQTLVAAGLTVRVDGPRLVVSPASLLTDQIRHLIRDNKTSISAELRAAHELTELLCAAVNRTCGLRGDTEENRVALIAECTQLMPEQQADIAEYF